MTTPTLVLHFNKFPEGTVSGNGNGYHLSMPSGQRQMDFDYKITRVTLSLKWKDHGWGDEAAKLQLWRGIFAPSGRLDKSKGHRRIAVLTLAKYQRSEDKGGINTVERVFTPNGGPTTTTTTIPTIKSSQVTTISATTTTIKSKSIDCWSICWKEMIELDVGIYVRVYVCMCVCVCVCVLMVGFEYIRLGIDT